LTEDASGRKFVSSDGIMLLNAIEVFSAVTVFAEKALFKVDEFVQLFLFERGHPSELPQLSEAFKTELTSLVEGFVYIHMFSLIE
jgi:hypothetical protein